ncbi:MAG TPA: bifunctional UDP-N-acetylmuramoyl-tripeptide:D-alanyl-D-alanine ligase/alanine racemase [Parafilimonas sp.]|nr:bifunctional UDP-N-acetylmuramoyl-tripeptide:D-alanyl-D-alanine ligase/alanine racemase [Parafilimonas sp.]
MYEIGHIASILSAESRLVNKHAAIEQLLTDSRRLIFPETTLFFAIATQRRNAAIFISELYERGVRNFVVHKDFDTTAFTTANFIFTDDMLAALQSLAAFHRMQFSYPVIAITGSNGKTIVKEWLYQLLSSDHNIVRSPRSYNSQLGVPLSVWQMNNDFDLAIFEAGISMPGEMQTLANIIRPTIGILTNIGSAHDENFVSSLQKTEEKCKLFTGCDIVIANGDDTAVIEILSHQTKAELITWGNDAANTIHILSQQKKENTTCVNLQYQDKITEVIIPFTDEASIQNIITCSAVLIYFKIPVDTINEGLQTLQPVDMRLQLIPAINNCALINDSYSFDIASFSVALDFMQQQNQFTQKTVILSDLPGENNKGAYAEIIFMMKARDIQKAIVIGEQWKTYYPFLKEQISDAEHFFSRASFLDKFSTGHFRNELILLKGARKFHFENIAAVLQQKVHRTVLEINLTAIIHNLNAYRKILRPGVKIMAMVKASGYGSGSAEIANALQYHKADYLAVAYADEGVDLRKANIRLPIMIMNIDEDAFESVIQFNLEPEIYSINIFKSFDAFLDKQGLQFYPVHIKIDTGMHRLGFGEEDIEILTDLLKAGNRIVIRSVFSHLAAGEDANEDAFTLLQAKKFEDACNAIESALGYTVIKHLSNSAATFRLPQLQFDMVRLGIGLYGIDGSNNMPALQPAVTLKTTVAQLRKVKAGDTVGYNRRGKIQSDSMIATLRIGYADGLRRSLSNGIGKVFLHGKLAPVVGSIAMDMTMVDVTHIPGVKEQDEAEIFGNNISVTEVARQCNTIPYEILTGINQRVKRIYIEE